MGRLGRPGKALASTRLIITKLLLMLVTRPLSFEANNIFLVIHPLLLSSSFQFVVFKAFALKNGLFQSRLVRNMIISV
jgi:hypothetical protein